MLFRQIFVMWMKYQTCGTPIHLSLLNFLLTFKSANKQMQIALDKISMPLVGFEPETSDVVLITHGRCSLTVTNTKGLCKDLLAFMVNFNYAIKICKYRYKVQMDRRELHIFIFWFHVRLYAFTYYVKH